MKTRRAFTLIEILTVTVIIGILVTIVTVAVAGAMRAAKRAKIGVEENHISMSLENYKNEIGEYPPDMFDDEALVRHVKKRWPRLQLPNGDTAFQAGFIRGSINGGCADAYGANVDFTTPLSPMGSLVLWLGGFPDAEGKFSGFSADPENPFFVNPFVKADERVYDKKAFIAWELGDTKSVRLFQVDANVYVPVVGNEVGRGIFVPFLYFRGKADGGNYAYRVGEDVKQIYHATFGLCVPYAEDKNADNDEIKWQNPTTFQLLHPGLDGMFGDDNIERIIKLGIGINLPDLDNITNFSGYKELQSILP